MDLANENLLLSSQQGEYDKYPTKRKRGRPQRLPNVGLVVTETVDQTPTRSDSTEPLGPIVMGLPINDKLNVSKADCSGQLLKMKKTTIKDDEKQLASADHENVESEPPKEGEVTNLKRKRGRPPKVPFGFSSPKTNEAVPESAENKKQSIDVVSSTEIISPTNEVENPVSDVEPLPLSISTPSSDACTKNVGICDQFIRLGDISRLNLGQRSTAREQGRKHRRSSKVATGELANTIMNGGEKLISTKQAEHPTGGNLADGAEFSINNGIGRHVGVAGTSSNACDDDKPLSTWLEEVHSLPPSTDTSHLVKIGVLQDEIETPSCDQPKEKTQTEKDETLAGYSSRDDDVTKRPDERVIQSTAIAPRESRELPFVKSCSLLWEVVESSEVLKRIPQKPHFFPLYKYSKHSREGLAIGHMVMFTTIAERISQARFDDPKSQYEEYLKALVDLEEQGFNVAPVRELLDKLISIKSRCEEAQNTSKEIESQVMKRKREISQLDDEIAELEKKIIELKEKQTQAVSEKEAKESAITLFQLSMGALKDGLASAQEEFEKVAASLW